MTWQYIPKYRYFSGVERYRSLESFKVNEQCFIRKEHKCGKVFGASKSCFIACPEDDELEPILALIAEKLSKSGVESIVAVKERAYGQDIFCTKICGKIIESRFCIVILNDTILDGQNIPNPNVYYEYGLMTALRKHIVTLQKEDLKLDFNIQSYDTIKYTSANVATELDRAIKDAIRITESEEKREEKVSMPDKLILRTFELAGFEAKEDNWFLSQVIDDTNFRGFGHYDKKFYLYLGKIDAEKEFSDYLEDLKVVIYRTEKKARELATDLKEQEEQLVDMTAETRPTSLTTVSFTSPYEMTQLTDKVQDVKNKLDLMSTVFVSFIVNGNLKPDKFIREAKSAISEYPRFQLSYTVGNDITFGNVKVRLVGAEH